MSDLEFDSGSFRDPTGKIFYKNKKVYRKLFKSGSSRFKFLKDNGLLEDLIKKKYIVCDKLTTDLKKILTIVLLVFLSIILLFLSIYLLKQNL